MLNSNNMIEYKKNKKAVDRQEKNTSFRSHNDNFDNILEKDYTSTKQNLDNSLDQKEKRKDTLEVISENNNTVDQETDQIDRSILDKKSKKPLVIDPKLYEVNIEDVKNKIKERKNNNTRSNKFNPNVSVEKNKKYSVDRGPSNTNKDNKIKLIKKVVNNKIPSKPSNITTINSNSKASKTISQGTVNNNTNSNLEKNKSYSNINLENEEEINENYNNIIDSREHTDNKLDKSKINNELHIYNADNTQEFNNNNIFNQSFHSKTNYSQSINNTNNNIYGNQKTDSNINYNNIPPYSQINNLDNTNNSMLYHQNQINQNNNNYIQNMMNNSVYGNSYNHPSYYYPNPYINNNNHVNNYNNEVNLNPYNTHTMNYNSQPKDPNRIKSISHNLNEYETNPNNISESQNNEITSNNYFSTEQEFSTNINNYNTKKDTTYKEEKKSVVTIDNKPKTMTVIKENKKDNSKSTSKNAASRKTPHNRTERFKESKKNTNNDRKDQSKSTSKPKSNSKSSKKIVGSNKNIASNKNISNNKNQLNHKNPIPTNPSNTNIPVKETLMTPSQIKVNNMKSYYDDQHYQVIKNANSSVQNNMDELPKLNNNLNFSSIQQPFIGNIIPNINSNINNTTNTDNTIKSSANNKIIYQNINNSSMQNSNFSNFNNPNNLNLNNINMNRSFYTNNTNSNMLMNNINSVNHPNQSFYSTNNNLNNVYNNPPIKVNSNNIINDSSHVTTQFPPQTIQLQNKIYTNYKNVKCSFCLKALNEPIILTCEHLCCLECSVEIKSVTEFLINKRTNYIECPECLMKTFYEIDPNYNIPSNRIKIKTELQASLLVAGYVSKDQDLKPKIVYCDICPGDENYLKKHAEYECLNCDVAICQDCKFRHLSHPRHQDHKIIQLNSFYQTKVETLLCEIHKEPLKLYCLTEKKPCCLICANYDNFHGNHEVKSLRMIIENSNIDFGLLIRDGSYVSKFFEAYSIELSKIKNQISEEYSFFRQKATQTKERLINLINQRHQEVEETLKDTFQTKIDDLEFKVNNLTFLFQRFNYFKNLVVEVDLDNLRKIERVRLVNNLMKNVQFDDLLDTIPISQYNKIFNNEEEDKNNILKNNTHSPFAENLNKEYNPYYGGKNPSELYKFGKENIESITEKLSLKNSVFVNDPIDKVKKHLSKYDFLPIFNNDLTVLYDLFKDSNTVSTKMINSELFSVLPKIRTGALLYRVSRDGASPDTFHYLCDNKGPTISIIKTIDNYIFGGYNPISWISENMYNETDDAFLFSLSDGKFRKPYKCSLKKSKKKYSIKQSEKEFSPGFGETNEADLFIAYKNINNSYSCLGNVYSCPEGFDSTTFLAGKNRGWEIADIEVYAVEVIDYSIII